MCVWKFLSENLNSDPYLYTSQTLIPEEWSSHQECMMVLNTWMRGSVCLLINDYGKIGGIFFFLLGWEKHIYIYIYVCVYIYIYITFEN